MSCLEVNSDFTLYGMSNCLVELHAITNEAQYTKLYILYNNILSVAFYNLSPSIYICNMWIDF